MFAKEVLFIIRIVTGCDRKCLTCTFRISTCDEWGVEIDETLVLEELMNGHGKRTSDTEYRHEGVCPWTKVSDLPKIFKGMSLLLQRICIVTSTFQIDFSSLNFKWLLAAWGDNISADDTDGSTGEILCDFRIVGKCICTINNLCILEICAIIQGNKGYILARTVCSDPALQLYIFNLVFF